MLAAGQPLVGSHIAGDPPAAEHGPEGQKAVEDGDGAWFAVLSCAAAQARAYPGGVGVNKH